MAIIIHILALNDLPIANERQSQIEQLFFVFSLATPYAKKYMQPQLACLQR
jgi:hypothetical protein